MTTSLCCALCRTIPQSFERMLGLMLTFDGSFNQLTGALYIRFSKLAFLVPFTAIFASPRVREVVDKVRCTDLSGAVPNFTTGAFHLSLKGNNLQTLPEEWRTNGTSSGFTNIMELSNNSLSGPFPYNLNRTCKFLRYLDIAYNNFR